MRLIGWQVHERSSQSDFLLVILKEMLTKRRDLKVRIHVWYFFSLSVIKVFGRYE